MGKKKIEAFFFRKSNPDKGPNDEKITGKFALACRPNVGDKIPVFGVKALVVEVSPVMDSRTIEILCTFNDADFDKLREYLAADEDLHVRAVWKYQRVNT